MGDQTAISWADKTFNIWIGCAHAPAGPGKEGTAPECDNCYAEAWDRRDLHGERGHWGADAPRRFLSDAYWRKPIAWNREAAERGVRFRVFCSSLADWAERHSDPQINARMDQERRRLWQLIRETPYLDWLLLTKRPGSFASMLPWGPASKLWFGEEGTDRGGWLEPWPNVWLGVTAGARVSLWRIPLLRSTPAAKRFVSCEPLLDGITAEEWDRVLGAPPACFAGPAPGPVHWLIVGDESGKGPGIRPAHPAWVGTAIEAAERHGAIPHFKQWAGAGHPDIEGSLDAERGARKIHLPVYRGQRYDGVPR
jgi:protein gp37